MRSIPLRHPRAFFIDGAWTAPSSGAVTEVRDCATEAVVAEVALAQDADMRLAVEAARRAFDEGPWPQMTPAERAEFLSRFAERLEARNDEFAAIWSIESGVVYKVALPRIGTFLGGAFRQYAAMAENFVFDESHRSMTGNAALKQHEPVGVVAVIVPWNGPAGLLAYKMAPALLAGCTMVVKSPIEAPCSGQLFAEICEEIGLPPGVVNVITADRDVSEALVAHPQVDKITFTGSTAAGRAIGAVAAQRMARVTLELGGKSPAILLEDFDAETAARSLGAGVFGYLSGQVCHAPTRVIVPRARHDAMVEGLCRVAQGMVLGDPFDAATTMGPLASARQRDTVERYVAIGQAEGAVLACGGSRPTHPGQGYFFEPTVFAHVESGMRIAQEEIFGPVLSVIPAEDEQHAVRIANDTIYGLNAVVFTHDRDKALSLARRLRTGSVGQNASRTDFTIGFGGMRQSGIGREGGVEGLKAFLETKTVVLDEPAA